ncbi:MAG: SRPBCC domain-containing protein [Acidimicrobiia bacterium]
MEANGIPAASDEYRRISGPFSGLPAELTDEYAIRMLRVIRNSNVAYREVNALVTDQIERTITVSATPDLVWAALTTEEGMSAWFGDIAKIDLRPGGDALFGWTDDGKSYQAVIEKVEPHTRFAFRWAANPDTPVDEGPSTLVEFLIATEEGGTRITVVESGFASFPEAVRDWHVQENTMGWKSELDELVTYVEGAAS